MRFRASPGPEGGPWRKVSDAYFFIGGVVLPPICSHVPFATYFQSPAA